MDRNKDFKIQQVYDDEARKRLMDNIIEANKDKIRIIGYSADDLIRSDYLAFKYGGKPCLLRRKNKCCIYCDIKLLPANKTREHVIPKNKGGGGLIIMNACYDCNYEKGNRTLTQYIDFLSIKPNQTKQDARKIKNATRLRRELLATFNGIEEITLCL